MTKSDIIHYSIHIIEALIITVLLLLLWKTNSTAPDIVEVPIEIRDTVTVEKKRIVEHTKTEYITKYDTVIIVGTDTTGCIDSIAIELPIEHKVYEDTISTDSTNVELHIEYSGFKPSLDSIGISYHYEGEKAVEVKKRGLKRFVGVGAYCGVGTGYDLINKNVCVSPQIGVCVTYGFGYTF